MSVSRRIFLWNSTLAAAACAIPLEAIGQHRQVPGEPAPIQAGLHSGTVTFDPYAALAHMDRDRFISAIGSDFMLMPASLGSPTVSLRLLAVKDLPGPPPPDPATYVTRNLAVPFVGTTGFMLLFSTTSPDALPQDTYSFSHATLGPFVMFIVPEGLGKGQYSAIVNRLNASPATAAPVSDVGRAQVPAASPTASGPASTTSGPAFGSPASTSSDSGNLAPQQVGNRGARKAAERD